MCKIEIQSPNPAKTPRRGKGKDGRKLSGVRMSPGLAWPVMLYMKVGALVTRFIYFFPQFTFIFTHLLLPLLFGLVPYYIYIYIYYVNVVDPHHTFSYFNYMCPFFIAFIISLSLLSNLLYFLHFSIIFLAPPLFGIFLISLSTRVEYYLRIILGVV